MDGTDKKRVVIQASSAQIFSFVGNTTSVYYSLSAHESEKQPVNVEHYEINPEKKCADVEQRVPRKAANKVSPEATFPLFALMHSLIS